jgi:hypothetical protein
VPGSVVVDLVSDFDLRGVELGVVFLAMGLAGADSARGATLGRGRSGVSTAVTRGAGAAEVTGAASGDAVTAADGRGAAGAMAVLAADSLMLLGDSVWRASLLGFRATKAAPPRRTTPATRSGAFRRLPRSSGSGSSSSNADDAAGAGANGIGAAMGLLRVWPGRVCVMRVRSGEGAEGRSAASLITTAGVDGSSFGMYGLDGVVRPRATDESGALDGGGGIDGSLEVAVPTAAGSDVAVGCAAGGAACGACTSGDRTGGGWTRVPAGRLVTFRGAGNGAGGAPGGGAGPTTIGAIPCRVGLGVGFVAAAVGAAGAGAGATLAGGGSASSSGSSHDAVKRSERRSASLSLSGAAEGR